MYLSVHLHSRCLCFLLHKLLQNIISNAHMPVLAMFINNTNGGVTVRD